MPDGSTTNQTQAASAESVKKVLDLQNWSGWKLARNLTADELAVFASARDAGAVIVPRMWREYLAGEGGFPFQFEGCSYSIHPGDEWAHPKVSENIAKRDAFLIRLREGDLAPVVARIGAAKSQREAA